MRERPGCSHHKAYIHSRIKCLFCARYSSALFLLLTVTLRCHPGWTLVRSQDLQFTQSYSLSSPVIRDRVGIYSWVHPASGTVIFPPCHTASSRPHHIDLNAILPNICLEALTSKQSSRGLRRLPPFSFPMCLLGIVDPTGSISVSPIKSSSTWPHPRNHSQ